MEKKILRERSQPFLGIEEGKHFLYIRLIDEKNERKIKEKEDASKIMSE